ncbi:activator of 90 kDa heat shock protein ATPase homolog 1-like isoform X1 [Schistocerca piceifrons]|uniref:activator of 90 kDa heat shock protein ATPase homolog 1-like isoform X1 n=1 Tax=Schistocerca piceifrons TaxID=274613 RepID=UPI001F5FD0CA|nr:activator of 90 kDa heat shock protein ATPase homolog 1-like isoform X1 [Schistocerca piceifrons]XP_047115498.1 activator of 90 kDa heat shock protein ATPase homolog 1-like isoform X1 [Schistocerca piceifrons]
MAKWGEGDTRWIVEQRADATNVNNWHWTEKNARQWSINKLQELLTGLKIENALDFSKGMILARKSEGMSETKTTKTGDTERLSQVLFEKVPVSKSEQEVKQLKTVKTGTLTMTIKLQCTKEEFYCALTNKEMVEAFTKSGVKMDVEPGGTFELLRGNISGQFLELVPNSKIYQTWRISNWPDGHFSTVLIEIEQLLDGIEVKLTQESIPESHLDTMKDNWNRYYWDAMRGTFGFGAFLA